VTPPAGAVRQAAIDSPCQRIDDVYTPELQLKPDAKVMRGHRVRPVHEQTLKDLLFGDVLLVYAPDLLPSAYCDRAVEAIDRTDIQPYEKTLGTPVVVHKGGPAVFDYIGDPRGYEAYFELAGSYAAEQRRQFARAGIAHPLDIFQRLLSAWWPGPVEVASENGVPYFAGVARYTPSGIMRHSDDAATESPELVIGKVVQQFSILIYLSMAAEGGAITVYDKMPSAVDLRENLQDYGLAARATAGVPACSVTPAKGSLVMFPTRNIHVVEGSAGDGRRMTVSTFAGVMPDGRLVLWS
jgi:hypothetical protein